MKVGYCQLAPVNQGFKPISADRTTESSRVPCDAAQERPHKAQRSGIPVCCRRVPTNRGCISDQINSSHQGTSPSGHALDSVQST
jgi:hypothetical protein